jgi:carboxyl-terminal processing protease
MGKLRGASMLVLGASLGLGIALGARWFEPPASHPSLDAETLRPADETVRLVGEIIARVRREYVDGIDEQRLVDGAIRGILTELDQHSTYLDAGAYQDIRIATTGNYTGVGLDVSLEGGKVTVVAPLDGAPAQLAGIRSGDVVIAVDGVPVDPANVAASVDRMRGAPGTNVTIEVSRKGDEKRTFTLTRAEVKVKTVATELLDNGLAYVRLSAFADSTPYDLAKEARTLMRKSDGKLRGVVLDLRNNPGGVLDAAIGVADAFLGEGLIVSGTGRGPHAHFEQYARKGDLLEGVAAVVLVNGGSASASEIVAGALQDHHRALVVGERTYGKGSVQTVMPVGLGAAIKLTTSRYLTPSGRVINGHGIDPDELVASADPLRHYRGPSGPVAVADDAQLVKALDLLRYDTISFSHAK